MKIVPAWIFEETEEGYRVLLGSQPRMDAEKTWIPKEDVDSCTYSPSFEIPRFALLVLKEKA